jgi:ABC-2 type transport system ATP-binding protein
VLLLDEPASGLDPDARHALASLFLRLRDEGMTLLVSSHILAELDAYSTHMLVLRGGRIVSHEPLAASRARPAGPVAVTLELARPFEGLVDLLRGIEGVAAVRVEGLTVTADMPGDGEARHRILRRLVDAGVPVCAFGGARRSMEEAYLSTLAAPPRAGEGR